MQNVSFDLFEWESKFPEPGSDLEGLNFGSDQFVRDLADTLCQTGRLEVIELSKGLSIKAFSYVGTVRLGNIKITVRPKITGAPLLNLLRYALECAISAFTHP